MLDRGTKLGPYEILELLGAGGMGEVYKARDTRLERIVAIKVLPKHLAANTEMRQRQEREARAISSLAHPNICTLFDIGHEDGADYLVMEFLEGETLARRLAKGPIDTADVLCYAIQIAEALDHAQRKGVLHRDLKPGNIMLTKSGAKLLDFGLAKLGDPAPAGDATATITAAITERGSILGTIQYMAPEQLEGKATDTRADIFAFGAVLYEMATGQRAFEGLSRISVMSAIMERNPPSVSSLRPMAPPALDHFVERCLAKDPEQRWQTARDLMLEMRWIGECGSQADVRTPDTVRRRSRRLTWIAATVAAGVLFLAAVAVLAITNDWFRPKRLEVGPVRFELTLPEDTTLAGGPASPQLALSPDGRQIAFAAVTKGTNYVWLRRLDSLSAQRLDQTDGATYPFWSPDGQSIGFFADNALKRIAASGGSPQTICAFSGVAGGGTWNRDGIILFALDLDSPVQRVPAAGGLPTPVTKLDHERHENRHVRPQFLPDGKHFLFFVRSAEPQDTGIYVQQLESEDRTVVLRNPTFGAFAPPDFLLFARDRTLFAQFLDLSNYQLRGEPFPIGQDVNENEINGRAAFHVSSNGVLVYRMGANSRVKQLSWYTRDGKRAGKAGEPGQYSHMALSPDEKRVVVARVEGTGVTAGLWILDLGNDIFTRLTPVRPAVLGFPKWSPDSQRIVFSDLKKGVLSEITVSSGAVSDLLADKNSPTADDFFPDGASLLYSHDSVGDVFLLALSGDRRAQLLFKRAFAITRLRISPDGRWVAYASLETGVFEVYVASFPSFGERQQISTGGANYPTWSKDGKEVFYVSHGQLMAAPVKAASKLDVQAARPLFPIRVSGRGHQIDVAQGERFLVNEELQDTGPRNQIQVVLNWAADIKR
jgi:Tol biopolymer transport system component